MKCFQLRVAHAPAQCAWSELAGQISWRNKGCASAGKQNGHWNSEFSHEKLWFSIATLVYQRVYSGWWLSPTPLKNDGVKVSWGLDYSQYMESHKSHVPNHQPNLSLVPPGSKFGMCFFVFMFFWFCWSTMGPTMAYNVTTLARLRQAGKVAVRRCKKSTKCW